MAAYQYAPPAGFTKLPAPIPGTRGHFDHHEQLEAKLNLLEAHLGVQATAVWTAASAAITALEQRVAELEKQVAALSHPTP